MLIWEEADIGENGIPTSAVRELEEEWRQKRVRVHGYMLLSGKKILAEHYYAPYTRKVNHRMYSITKSFVALAVGVLLRNGLIKLNDRICDYFPEKLPAEGVHPWCAELTIREMLTMQTCHGKTTYKGSQNEDWTQTFFQVKPDHVSGTVFSYDTSSAHVLCALVEKLTGKQLLDYLREELLDELGFSKEAYVLKDPVGVSQGGSGLMCTLRDVAGVAYLFNHSGMLDGRELLPREFMQQATAALVPTDLQPMLDEQGGYGFFIWKMRPSGENTVQEGFTLFGLGGQLAICLPGYDFCFLTMADTMGNPAGVQLLHDSFYRIIFPHLKKKNGGREALISAEPLAEKKRHGSEHYEFYDSPLNWRSIDFFWEEKAMVFTIPCGSFRLQYGEKDACGERIWQQQKFLNTDYCCECSGYWKNGHFFLEIFLTGEEQGNIRMEFAWKDVRLGMRCVSAMEPVFDTLRKHFQGFASAVCKK